MLRNRLGFCLLALGAAVLAACSTSGSGGNIVPGAFQALRPSSVQSFSNDARHRRQPVRAGVYLRIPVPHHRRSRMHPQYISPGTASISFSVQPIAASGPRPTPMPLQTMNVATPAPCKTVSRGAALMCAFTVSVMPGRDSFVVKTYSRANAKGKTLSQYSSGPTIVPTPDSSGKLVPLGFTLEGAIDHVVLRYPSAVVPADTQGQVGAIPIGVATSAPLNVTPYDGDDYEILSQYPVRGTPVPYAAPIKLSVTPAGKGITLSNALGSGNSVTISNPNDLDVNVNYSGVFTVSAGTVTSATSFSIAASGSTLALRARKIDVHASRAATPAPNAAGIALSSNAIPGGTVLTALSSPQPLGLVNVPGTGNMAFFGYGYNPTYASLMGTATGGVPETVGSNAADISQGFADSLGNLWAFDYATGRIDCFASGSYATPAGNIPSSTTIYPGGTLYAFAGFAEDSSDDLWFTLYGGQPVSGFWYTIGYVPISSTSCASPAASIYRGVQADQIVPLSIAAIPSSGTAAVGSYDATAGTGAVLVAATSAPTPIVTSVAIAGTPAPIIGGTSRNYTVLSGGSAATLGSLSATGTFSTIATYPAGLSTFFLQTTSSASSASGVLGTTTYDGSYVPSSFVTLLDPADNNPSTNLQALSLGAECQGLAFDAQDTPWALCANASNNLQFYHIVATSTWSVLPGTVIPVKIAATRVPISGTIYLGMLEAFGTNSGPFKLTHYNTSVISGVTQEGDRGLSLTISEPSAGPYIENADVVDKNGRRVAVEFQIDASYSAGAPPRPGTRSHARRGYAAIPRN